MLQGFRCKILYYDTKKPEFFNSSDMKNVNMPELLADSDIVSVHFNETYENIKFVTGSYLEKLKHKYFINCSRSSIVDGIALNNSIGKLKGVYLDVIEDYDSVTKMELLRKSKEYFNNLHITFHTAGKGVDSRRNTDIYIVEQFKKWREENVR